MRSPDHVDEGDLDLRALRRTPARTSPAPKGWRRYVIGGLVTSVLALFAAVVWFAYQDLMPGGDASPPLIRAEAGPIKREPVERGGLPVVNAESAVVRALDEPDAPVRVERIMPRESTAPMSTADIVPEILEAEPADDRATASLALDQDGRPERTGAVDTLEALIAEVTGEPGGIGTAQASSTGGAPADAVRPIEELRAIEPASGTPATDTGAAGPPRIIQFEARAADDTRAADDAPAATVARPVAGAEAAASPGLAEAEAETVTALASAVADPAPVRPVSRPPAAAPAPARTPVQTPVQATAAPAPVQTAALPGMAPLAADFSGAFRVQLLAVRDEDAAAGAWASLQASYPGLLGPLRSRVQRADVGEATFYRLQAGPFADRAGAASVCSALQARGADCFVVDPAS